MNEIYYSPEKFGLTVVGQVEWGDACYSFDLTAVWRREDGQLVYGEDSGCSCPGIFEGQGISDLTAITPAELQAHLDARNKDNYGGDRGTQIAELMAAVNR